jgi:hypothetical protein
VDGPAPPPQIQFPRPTGGQFIAVVCFFPGNDSASSHGSPDPIGVQRDPDARARMPWVRLKIVDFSQILASGALWLVLFWGAES